MRNKTPWEVRFKERKPLQACKSDSASFQAKTLHHVMYSFPPAACPIMLDPALNGYETVLSTGTLELSWCTLLPNPYKGCLIKNASHSLLTQAVVFYFWFLLKDTRKKTHKFSTIDRTNQTVTRHCSLSVVYFFLDNLIGCLQTEGNSSLWFP